MLWDDCKIDLEVVSLHDQIITVAVKNGNLIKWMFSIVYASPKTNFRNLLRDYLA